MKYVLKPSDEHIALVKQAAMLWNQDDVRSLLAEFYIPKIYKQFHSKWVKIEAITMEKVAYLPLPKEMKEKLLGFIKPVGLQIIKWRQFHYKGCDITVGLPHEFCWMPEGIIDKKKTAEVMIRDENIDIVTRYKLSCIFCLEDDIPKLWEKVPESSKKLFYNEEDPAQVKQKELVVLWTYLMKGEGDKMDSVIEKKMERKCSPYQYAFELAAVDGNRVATEYFLHKLTPAEKKESLVKTAASVAKGRHWNTDERTGYLNEIYSEVLCYLLSELNDEQQSELFKRQSNEVLLCLLDFPWQPFFMETANRTWGLYSKLSYQYTWIHFTGNPLNGYKDFDYGKLLREFWMQSPPDYKSHFLDNCTFHRIVAELFQIKDEESIKFLFQEIAPEKKRGIIYDEEDGFDICNKLMKGNMRLLKYFIKECLPSVQDLQEFRDFFDEFHVNEFDFLQSSWQHKFLRVIDDVMREYKKRKAEISGCSKTMKV